MAERKVVLVLAPAADTSGGRDVMDKLLKKGALLPNYTPGPLPDEGIEAGTAVTIGVPGVAKAIEDGTPLLLVDLGGASAAEVDGALATILDAMDRRTTLALVTKGALLLYGAGIDTKAGTVNRPIASRDVLPTLAAIADFPLSRDCTGAVIYQALKSPNAKLDEVRKLKEAVQRMEGALARDNREPWDKHDCA